MIEDQGEAAIVIEVDKKMNSSPFITNLILAKENRFDKKELKHIFLTASLEKEQFKEKKAGERGAKEVCNFRKAHRRIEQEATAGIVVRSRVFVAVLVSASRILADVKSH